MPNLHLLLLSSKEVARHCRYLHEMVKIKAETNEKTTKDLSEAAAQNLRLEMKDLLD